MSDTQQIQEEAPLVDEREDQNDWMENISCDLGLRQHLDAELKADEGTDAMGEVHKQVEYWTASGLGGDLYARYARRKGLSRLPFSPRTLRKFLIGKLWEAKLHEVLDRMLENGHETIKKIDLHPDKADPWDKWVVNEELHIRSFYDRMLLVRVNETDWKIVLYEIKSVASRMFHNQKKEGEQPRGNRMQLMFYMERIQSPENWQKLVAYAQEQYGITPVGLVGVLSQVSKDDGSMWERTYEFDPALYAEIEKEVQALNGYWERDEFPPKPPVLVVEHGVAKINWHVRYSDYIHHILGSGYADVLKKAEQLVRRHAYYRKSAPSKVAFVEAQIAEFNKQYQ